MLNFVTRLRTASKFCEFDKVNEEILSAVLSNGTSIWLTTKALGSTEEPTLASVMKMALAENQAAAMVETGQDQEAVNYTRTGQTRSQRPPGHNTKTPPSYTSPRNSYSQGKPCGYCGRDPRHETCPAAKEACHENEFEMPQTWHFKKVCRSKKAPDARHKSKRAVNWVAEETDEEGNAQDTYEYASRPERQQRPSNYVARTRSSRSTQVAL